MRPGPPAPVEAAPTAEALPGGGAPFTFTVFTPTFNRGHLLPRARESLQAQTLRDFEWLIVDDGSTDGTRALVAGWLEEPRFPIRYLHQPNSGKHVAFNRGVAAARGELFVCLDSDDALVPNALERLLFHWNALPAAERPRFSAVSGLCVDQHGDLIGDRFPEDVWDSDALTLYFRHRIRGDKFGFQLTEVLRRHPFPEPPGCRFVSEDVVWFAIARRYMTRFVNEALQLHDVQTRPDRDNLTRLTRATAAGRLLFHRAVLGEYLGEALASPRRLLRSLVNHARYSFWCEIGVPAQLRSIPSTLGKVLAALASPVGYAAYRRDRR